MQLYETRDIVAEGLSGGLCSGDPFLFELLLVACGLASL